MKPIEYIIVSASIFAFAPSCDKMLNNLPEDKITPDTFFRNEMDLRLYTNNFYPQCISQIGIYNDIGDIVITYDLADEVSGQRIIPETSGGFNGWGWGALRDINYYLSNSSHCPDERIRRRYDALARFFRALFYYTKVTRYGDVPWYDSVLGSDSDALYKPRDSRETVMQHILEDIDYAIENLPSSKSLYEVTKWTALALKTRICLFEGTFRKYHGIEDYEKYLQECAEAGDEFITQSGYAIAKDGATPYQTLFSDMNANPKEIILARDFNSSLNLRHNAQGFCNSPGTATRGLTRHLVNLYLMKDGTKFTDKPGFDTMTFIEESKDRDPRMAQTIRTPGYTREDGKKYAPDLKIAILGYQPIKYVGALKYDTQSTSENDLPIFRAAEVYLNYAESKAELGNLTQTDIDKSIKPIRARVGMPNLNMAAANANPDSYLSSPETGYPNVTGPNKGVILEIRRERTIELVLEGFRYNDIMRWKAGALFTKPMLGMYFPGYGSYDMDGDGRKDVDITAETVLSEGDKGCLAAHWVLNRVWNEDRDYLFPIPTKERILTKGSLAQNPGWNDGLNF